MGSTQINPAVACPLHIWSTGTPINLQSNWLQRQTVKQNRRSKVSFSFEQVSNFCNIDILNVNHCRCLQCKGHDAKFDKTNECSFILILTVHGGSGECKSSRHSTLQQQFTSVDIPDDTKNSSNAFINSGCYDNSVSFPLLSKDCIVLKQSIKIMDSRVRCRGRNMKCI